MRDAREWAEASFIDPQYLDDMTDMIRAIQSDAARSERERAAAECDRMCKEASDIGCASRYVHVREGQAMLATAFREVADYLRDTPDANTDGVGEGAA